MWYKKEWIDISSVPSFLVWWMRWYGNALSFLLLTQNLPRLFAHANAQQREKRKEHEKNPLSRKNTRGKEKPTDASAQTACGRHSFPTVGEKIYCGWRQALFMALPGWGNRPEKKTRIYLFFIAPLFSTYILGNPLAQGTNVNVRRREEKEKDEVGRRVVAGVGGKESSPPPPPPASFGANQTPPHRRRRGGGQRSSLSLIALSPQEHILSRQKRTKAIFYEPRPGRGKRWRESPKGQFEML